MTYSSRKRTLSSDQDVCEFSPISKRINNIHIRSNGTKLLNESGEKSQQHNGIIDVHGGNTSGENHVSHQSNHYPDAVRYQSLSNANYLGNGSESSFSGHSQLTNCHNDAAAYNSLAGEGQQRQWIGAAEAPLPFEPELDERQNPIYYQVNEMLYQLHVERMRRMMKH